MPPAYSDKLRTAFLRVLRCVYDQFLYFIYIKKQTNKTKITKKSNSMPVPYSIQRCSNHKLVIGSVIS